MKNEIKKIQLTKGESLKKQSYSTLQSTKEFKDFLEEFVYNRSINMNEEVEYILNKSVEDTETPFSYDDFESRRFDIDKAKYLILEEIETIKEDEDTFKEFLEEVEDNLIFNRKKDDLIKFINNLTEEEEFKNLVEISYLNHIDSDEDFYSDNEVLSWYMMDDRLLYQLEERNEVILNKVYWGRQTYGQRIELDGVIISIFKEWFLNIEWVKQKYNLNEVEENTEVKK